MFGMLDMLIGGLMPCRLFREFNVLNCDGEPPAKVTASLTGGGVSGSGNVTSGSVRSVSSDPLPSLESSRERSVRTAGVRPKQSRGNKASPRVSRNGARQRVDYSVRPSGKNRD